MLIRSINGETPEGAVPVEDRGPNTEAGGKPAYNNVQVGVGRRNKFCENIISVPLPLAFT